MPKNSDYKKTYDLGNQIIIFSAIFLFFSSSILNALGFVIFTIGFLVVLYAEKVEQEIVGEKPQYQKIYNISLGIIMLSSALMILGSSDFLMILGVFIFMIGVIVLAYYQKKIQAKQNEENKQKYEEDIKNYKDSLKSNKSSLS